MAAAASSWALATLGRDPQPRTVLQDGLSLRAVDLLPPDEVAGGVSEVDEARLSMEVQRTGVHEVLNGDHVLVRHLGPHVHPADDARTPLPIHQEQLVLGFCEEMGKAITTSPVWACRYHRARQAAHSLGQEGKGCSE